MQSKLRLIPTHEGDTVEYDGLALYSPHSPRTSAVRRARAIKILPKSLVYVPSPALGYGIAELIATMPNDCVVLCHELDPALAALFTPPIDDRVFWVHGDTVDDFLGSLSPETLSRLRRVVRVTLSGGYRIASAAYNRAYEQIERTIRTTWQNRITTAAMGRLWFRNLVTNLSLPNVSSIEAYTETDKPWCVVGAGPSLDAVIPTIASIRDRVLLVAADTALAVLDAHGITADVCVAVEAQSVNLDDITTTRSRPRVLFADTTTHPAFVRHFPEETRFFFCSRFTNLAFLRRFEPFMPTFLPALGSVGVVAVEIATRLSAGPVFIAGLDFSYSAGRTHALGSPQHLSHLRALSRFDSDPLFTLCVERRAIHATGKDGSRVLTNGILTSYAESLRSIVHEHRSRVFDLGATGLPIGVPMITGDRCAAIVDPTDTVPERKTPVARGAESPESAPYRTRQMAFSDELELLERAETASRAIARGNGDKSEYLAAISAVEYTYYDFPDADTVQTVSRGFASRVAISAAYYREKIARAFGL